MMYFLKKKSHVQVKIISSRDYLSLNSFGTARLLGLQERFSVKPGILNVLVDLLSHFGSNVSLTCQDPQEFDLGTPVLLLIVILASVNDGVVFVVRLRHGVVCLIELDGGFVKVDDELGGLGLVVGMCQHGLSLDRVLFAGKLIDSVVADTHDELVVSRGVRVVSVGANVKKIEILNVGRVLVPSSQVLFSLKPLHKRHILAGFEIGFGSFAAESQEERKCQTQEFHLGVLPCPLLKQ